MSSALRAVLFSGFLAAGTWIGLGKPSANDGRALVDEALRRAAAKAEEHAITKAPVATRDEETEYPSPPTRRDGEPTPSRRPWPELNAEASLERAWMVAEGPRYGAESGRRLVTLTFDDGPSPETTPKVLRVLAKHNVHATFFVIGRYVDGDEPRAKASREVLKQIVAEGHLVGNHTHDHVRLTTVTPTQVLDQIDQGAASIEHVTGRRPILFRPPFGELDDFGRAAVRERGLDLVLWSIEKRDMQRSDSIAMFRELASQIEYKGGGIVLLHDIRRSSLPALRELLGWLRDREWDPSNPGRVGYEIVDFPTYVREVASAPQPFATRDELERARSTQRHVAPTAEPARRPDARRAHRSHAVHR